MLTPGEFVIDTSNLARKSDDACGDRCGADTTHSFRAPLLPFLEAVLRVLVRAA